MEKGGLASKLGEALDRSNAARAAVSAPPDAPEASEVATTEASPQAGHKAGCMPATSGCLSVLFSDEMRLGLHGQVRRVWAPRGEKVEQVIQIVYRWTYLVLGVDPVAGRLVWAWVPNMKGATLALVLAAWKAQGVAAVVLDNAPGHRSAELKAVAPALVPLPPYSPELDPAERIFRALRPEIEGEVYASLDAKRDKAEAWLQALAADPDRVRSMTAWSWLVPQVRAAAPAPAPS